LTWILAVALIDYLFKLNLSRGIFLVTAFFVGISISVFRRIIYFRRRKKLNNGRVETLIIGRGNRSQNIERRLLASFPGLIIVKLDYYKENKKTEGNSIIDSLVHKASADIFIADEMLTREEVLTLLADKRLAHHRFKLVADVFKRATGEVGLDGIDDIPIISPHQKPYWLYLIGKRSLDLFLGCIGIIVSLPIWLFIIICIKLDSPGAIFFRQLRIGKDGQPFLLWKFRTMYADAAFDDYAPQSRDDKRITRVGKILRRFSLDELPQLLNVIAGNMSIVGPRPEMPFIVETYLPWQKFRLNVKPGITGLWQILGRKELPLHQNLEYDFYYVTNQSFFTDGVILLKTIPAVFFGRGAY
jgi:exopolysaccharide biosynthesis polyprenyl glycosylphosphotransferase